MTATSPCLHKEGVGGFTEKRIALRKTITIIINVNNIYDFRVEIITVFQKSPPARYVFLYFSRNLNLR